MAKKDNSLKWILLGAAALYFLGGGGRSNQRYFVLPNGQRVPESQLPSLGYVKYNGQWVHYSVLNQNTGQGGSAGQWQQWVNMGLDIIGQVADLFGNGNNQPILDSGSPGNGGFNPNDPYSTGGGWG